MYKIIFLSVLLSVSSAFAQLSEVKRITKDLCAENMHGRGYVNNGDKIAAEYIAKEFEKLGAEKIGDSYFQEFQLDVNTFPNLMQISHAGKNLVPGKDFVLDPSSKGFSGILTPVVIDTNTLLSEEKMTTVFEKVQTTENSAFLIDTRGTDVKTENELRSKLSGLVDFAAVIFITNQKFTWSVGREQMKNVFIVLQADAYSEEEKFNVNVEAKFIKNYTSQNVIAQIPAKKKCTKTIVFSAHYDHLGRLGKDTYFPGANDNASGTAMIISMAKHFKENPSGYNIVLIAFGGEEAGLVGSKYYTENPLFKLKNIKFLINLDIMGSGEEGITAVNATLFEKQFELLQKINDEDQLLAKVKRRGPAANSDHYFFTLQDVPCFFIYTMGPNKHYHDIFDTYEELTFKEYDDIKSLLVRFVEEL